jgi:hypothetical protein
MEGYAYSALGPKDFRDENEFMLRNRLVYW